MYFVVVVVLLAKEFQNLIYLVSVWEYLINVRFIVTWIYSPVLCRLFVVIGYEKNFFFVLIVILKITTHDLIEMFYWTLLHS